MAVVAFAYGVPTHGWHPLLGDWNGDGIETIGMFLPYASTFFLRNSNTVGNADVAFGLGYAGCQPIIGDWLGRDAVVQATSLTDGQPSGSLQLTATDAVFSQLDEGLSSDALGGLEPALS
jgi:hypothetical protein